MSGKRVYEYAKELGLENEELITRLEEQGIAAENHLSFVSEEKIYPLRPELYNHKGGPLKLEKLAQRLGLTPELLTQNIRLLKNEPYVNYEKIDTDTIKILTATQRSLRAEELARRLQAKPKKILKLLEKLERKSLHSRSRIDSVTVNVLEKIQIQGINDYLKKKKLIETKSLKLLGEEEANQTEIPAPTQEQFQTEIQSEEQTGDSFFQDYPNHNDFIFEERVAKKIRLRLWLRKIFKPFYILLLLIIIIAASVVVIINQIAYSNFLKLTQNLDNKEEETQSIKIGLPVYKETRAPESPEEKIVKRGAFAWLIIPRLNIDSAVLEGSSSENLNEGLSYNATSDKPGEGTTIIQGYQFNGKAPLARIGSLEDGDLVILYTRQQGFIYKVGAGMSSLLNKDVVQIDGSKVLKLVVADAANSNTSREVVASLQGQISEI